MGMEGSYPTHLLCVPCSTALGGSRCQEQGKRRDNATGAALAMKLIHKHQQKSLENSVHGQVLTFLSSLTCSHIHVQVPSYYRLKYSFILHHTFKPAGVRTCHQGPVVTHWLSAQEPQLCLVLLIWSLSSQIDLSMCLIKKRLTMQRILSTGRAQLRAAKHSV